VIELDVFVSCGAEVADLRDIAARALAGLERAFLRGLDAPLVIRYWDYRDEPPAVVAHGEFSAQSLRMVDSASAVIGILGATVPTVASQELLRAIERYASGQADNVWLFLASATKGDVHRNFLRKVQRKTKMTVLYQEFDGQVDFQEKLFVALIPYMVRKAILDRQTLIPAASGGVV